MPFVETIKIVETQVAIESQGDKLGKSRQGQPTRLEVF
jgi:hypothetical protein